MFRSILCLFVLLTMLATDLSANEDALTCQESYRLKIEDILSKLNHIEAQFVQYRWTEQKIRHLYYEDLWKARHAMNHPTDRELRKKGKVDEGRLLEILEMYEKSSSQFSNEFAHGVDDLLIVHSTISNACPETDFRYCISDSLEPFHQVISEVRKQFNHLFENERDFREKVAQKAAGREGFYPEDALEESDAHEDFYWRFERENEATRFQENMKFMELFREAHRILTWNFSGDSCCIRCQN